MVGFFFLPNLQVWSVKHTFATYAFISPLQHGTDTGLQLYNIKGINSLRGSDDVSFLVNC